MRVSAVAGFLLALVQPVSPQLSTGTACDTPTARRCGSTRSSERFWPLTAAPAPRPARLARKRADLAFLFLAVHAVQAR